MAELLLELFSEEIPARMQDRAREDLAKLILAALRRHELLEGEVRSFATPRRLVIVATGVKRTRPVITTTRKGPAVGAPAAALEGFRSSFHGEVDIRVENIAGKRYYIGQALQGFQASGKVLADELPIVIGKITWPNSMRWGEGEFRWVRPLHSILCLFDGEIVRFTVGGIASGNLTRGHRFMAPEPFPVHDFSDYVGRLCNAWVVLDGTERRQIIAKGAADLASAEGLVVDDDPGLLDELKGLVEWPVLLMGVIDQGFMALPAEALVTTMRTNQRYLALRNLDGALAPRFVAVANLVASDGGAAIVAGNERVLRARLWDARFFWEQDLKVPLESRLPALERMVFHAELGSLAERVRRLVALAGALAHFVPGADWGHAERGALLAKADLVTGMVGEFPELQGIMGGHYAAAQGEPTAVAAAIRDQYAPKGPDDRCPTEPVSVVVALAEKLDTLAGFFAVDLRPTGSKDPFALRRAALGVIRLILENALRLPLRAAFEAALQGYGERLDASGRARVAGDLLAFFADRLKVYLRERGVRHDLIAAAFAVGDEDDLRRLLARAQALQGLVDSEDGRNLLTAYRRASSIVAIEEKKDGRAYAGTPSPEALAEPAERALHAALVDARPHIDAALAAEDYPGAMAALAALRRPVDAFFDGVLVNSPEPRLRENRLLLLNQIRAGLRQVADFSLVEDVAHSTA